jgi:hypothetical protein
MRLDKLDRRSLVLWTTDCAEPVRSYVGENYPKDYRAGITTDQVIKTIQASFPSN